MDNKATGNKGEAIAKELLISKGYKIQATNWRHSYLEVDIICETEKEIIFVEVKTRSNGYFGDPIQSVSKKQQKNLINAAEAYIDQFEIDKEFRFDIIGILNENQFPEINHVEDAFGPEF